MSEPLIIYKRDGNVYFEYNIEIDEETAQDIQKDEGYHPAGYGFYDLQHIGGKTYWNCSQSAD